MFPELRARTRAFLLCALSVAVWQFRKRILICVEVLFRRSTVLIIVKVWRQMVCIFTSTDKVWALETEVLLTHNFVPLEKPV